MIAHADSDTSRYPMNDDVQNMTKPPHLALNNYMFTHKITL